MSLVRRIAPNQQAIPAVEYLISDAQRVMSASAISAGPQIVPPGRCRS
jgi:hypothetical protein